MDGFFDKYGRVIIIAVAICFVLLYLTPMRNVVGSSINGFAGNFANKVGESLGTVKMPDGSDNVKREPSSMLIRSYPSNYIGYPSSFYKEVPESATKIMFTDEKAPKGVSTTDLTTAKDGDVVGWLDGTTWKVSTQDSKKSITFNTDSSFMFCTLENIKEIEFNNINTSQVESMRDLFAECSALTNLDLSNIDTSKVTDMSYMFAYCEKLGSLDLSNFDTSKVTTMDSMFKNCSSLQSLDLNCLDTHNVTNMIGMFKDCKQLKSLNINNIDVSKVGNMASMFNYCTSLTTLNLGNWKTSNLFHTYEMFYECKNLEKLDLSHFDTSQIGNPKGNMDKMFYWCINLKSIKARSQTDIDNFKTKNTWIEGNTKFEIQ